MAGTGLSPRLDMVEAWLKCEGGPGPARSPERLQQALLLLLRLQSQSRTFLGGTVGGTSTRGRKVRLMFARETVDKDQTSGLCLHSCSSPGTPTAAAALQMFRARRPVWGPDVL